MTGGLLINDRGYPPPTRTRDQDQLKRPGPKDLDHATHKYLTHVADVEGTPPAPAPVETRRARTEHAPLMTRDETPQFHGPLSVPIRQRRRDLRLSQADLAWLADVSRGTISNLETGRSDGEGRADHAVFAVLGWSQPKDGAPAPLLEAAVLRSVLGAIYRIREDEPSFAPRLAYMFRTVMGHLAAGEPPTLIRDLAGAVVPAVPRNELPSVVTAFKSLGWEPSTTLSEGPLLDGFIQVHRDDVAALLDLVTAPSTRSWTTQEVRAMFAAETRLRAALTPSGENDQHPPRATQQPHTAQTPEIEMPDTNPTPTGTAESS